MRSSLRLALPALAAMALAALVAGPASAHTQLTGVDPAEGATVAAGQVVTLSFSEELLDLGAEATVTDASGAATPVEVTHPQPHQAALTLPDMAGGPVTLAWRVVAGDGHPVEGTLQYVADAPAEPSASPSPTASPSATASPAPTEAASPSATPAASTDDAGGNSGVQPAVWIAIGAALLAAIGGGAASRRGRGKDAGKGSGTDDAGGR